MGRETGGDVIQAGEITDQSPVCRCRCTVLSVLRAGGSQSRIIVAQSKQMQAKGLML